jgi:hypothetical protein
MAAMSDASRKAVDDLIAAVPPGEEKAVAQAVSTAYDKWIPKSDDALVKVWRPLIIGGLSLAALSGVLGTILSIQEVDGAAAGFAGLTGIGGLVIGLFATPSKDG